MLITLSAPASLINSVAIALSPGLRRRPRPYTMQKESLQRGSSLEAGGDLSSKLGPASFFRVCSLCLYIFSRPDSYPSWIASQDVPRANGKIPRRTVGALTDKNVCNLLAGDGSSPLSYLSLRYLQDAIGAGLSRNEYRCRGGGRGSRGSDFPFITSNPRCPISMGDDSYDKVIQHVYLTPQLIEAISHFVLGFLGLCQKFFLRYVTGNQPKYLPQKPASLCVHNDSSFVVDR